MWCPAIATDRIFRNIKRVVGCDRLQRKARLLNQLGFLASMKVVTLADHEGEEQASDVFVSTGVRHDVFTEDINGPGISLNEITFRPGERTKFHTHPHGQILYFTEGKGLVGTDTEQREVTAGDAVFFPPGENHWHGATPDSTVTHLSIVVLADGEGISSIGDDPEYDR